MQAATAILSKAMQDIEDLPVIPREVEGILTTSPKVSIASSPRLSPARRARCGFSAEPSLALAWRDHRFVVMLLPPTPSIPSL
ncbi:hypothetical protein [Mesorhizobium sp.]|uniref:hypothetical protein n=1 Tax=Mesorhizobium sp. TaxID=1871066 RepID=UPI0025C565A1|nr:hypothetical protein [Mesorhizobium sp.]